MLEQSLKIEVNKAEIGTLKTEGIVVGVFKGEGLVGEFARELDREMKGGISAMIESGEIRGDLKEFHILHNFGGTVQKIIILGCGDRKDLDRDTVRFFAAKGARTARKLSQSEVSILLEQFSEVDSHTLGVTAAEGLLMGLHRFEYYKSKKKSEKDHLGLVRLFVPSSLDVVEKGVRRGEILAAGNLIAREIANHPGNVMTPAKLMECALEIANRHNIRSVVMDEPELKEKGFNGICAVSQGSSQNCKLFRGYYRGNPQSSEVDIAVVGKGLTFDAGGISIKPAANMHMMKFDMAGGAGVIGAMHIIGTLAPKVNVNFYIPSSENLLGSSAYKPGDILNMYGKKTVEIQNTDAEGRLLLADAIALAVEEGAKRIVNTATLTGAVTVALGHVRTGMMTRNEELRKLVTEASLECDEKLWELPLDKEYLVGLKSSIADLSNSGGRGGGSSSAGAFLNEFAADVPFCHLDIAGTAWIENAPTQYSFKPYLPKEGATGTVARTIALMVEKLAK